MTGKRNAAAARRGAGRRDDVIEAGPAPFAAASGQCGGPRVGVRQCGGRHPAVDDWRDGARARLGLAVSGFPDFFLMYGPNTNVGSGSIVHMLESQIGYIVQAARALAAGVRYLDLREDVLDEFDDRIRRRLDGTVWNAGGCDSWYLRGGRRNASNWPGCMLGYRRATRRLDPADYHVVRR